MINRKKTWMKKIIGGFIAGVLCLQAAPIFASENYQDVPEGHWAEESIERARALGIMSGMDENTFGLGSQIKRSEFVSLLSRVFQWQSYTPESPTFSDVSDPSLWYYAPVESGVAAGVIRETGDTFRPEEPITREEMAVMLVRALGYDTLAGQVENMGIPFTDVTEQIGYITIAYDFGIISGKSSTQFDPKGTALREEAAAMMVRAYDKYQARVDYLHGFYAFSSYSQREMAANMDAVSYGWSQLEYSPEGGVVVNTTNANNNTWNVPAGYEEITAYLDQNEVTQYLNLFCSDEDVLSQVLLSPENRTALVEAVVSELTVEYAKTGNNLFDGITIDFEGMRGEELKEGFNAFLQELRPALDEIQKDILVAVPPVVFEDAYYDGYDYRTIGQYADKIILMAHDYSAESMDDATKAMGFTTTPLTPFPQIYYALKAITDPQTGVEDKNKIVLAFSMDTVGWTVQEDQVINTQALHPSYGEIYNKLNQSGVIMNYSASYRNPYIQYQNEDGSQTIVWYENGRSIQDKICLARMFGVNGLSVWRIGTIPNYTANGLNIWSTIQEERNAG